MPGETHQVGYGGDSVSASFQASRARCDVEASPDATLEDLATLLVNRELAISLRTVASPGGMQPGAA